MDWCMHEGNADCSSSLQKAPLSDEEQESEEEDNEMALAMGFSGFGGK